MPGLTASSSPMKVMSIPRSDTSASSPPTMCPRGQRSWYSTWGLGTLVPTGTETHGPATGTQTIKPSHSSAACAGPTRP